MANMGMIGAIGGLGQGLVNESVAIGKNEERAAETAAKKDYQGWLLKQQEQFEVKKDERAWANEQARAPTKRAMKAEDEKSSAKAKSEVAAETLDTDAKVKSTLAEAGQTKADKDLKGAQAKLYSERSDDLDSKTSKKLDPADAAEIKGIQARAGKLQDTIDKAMAEPGGWDPAKNPGQKQLQSQMATLQLRERAILQRYRSADSKDASPATADPLKIRQPPTKPGMIGPTNASEAGMKAEVNQPMGADPAALKREIAATRESMAKVSDESSRSQLAAHLADLERQQANLGATAKPGAAPKPATTAAPKPAVAAAPTDPTEALGQELDATRAAYKVLTQPDKRPGLAAGAPARQDYAAKVQSLRDKIRQQEKRYAEAVGGQSASFATARP